MEQSNDFLDLSQTTSMSESSFSQTLSQDSVFTLFDDFDGLIV